MGPKTNKSTPSPQSASGRGGNSVSPINKSQQGTEKPHDVKRHASVGSPQSSASPQGAEAPAIGFLLVLQKLDAICSDIRDIRKEVGDLTNSLHFTQNETATIKTKLDNIEGKQKSLEKQIEKQGREISLIKKENTDLKEKLEKMEIYSRRDNLIIVGLAETEGEDTGKVAQDFFASLIKDPVHIVRCHRLGGKTDIKSPRPLIVRFLASTDRNKIWAKRFELKGRNVWMKEDFPAETEQRRQRLYPILKEAKRLGKKAQLNVDKLKIEGKTYTVDTLASLPKDLLPENISTKRAGKQVLFYGRDSKFSNFHPCTIKSDGTTYNCSEQMYQHRKALAAGDTSAASKILSATDPVEQKRLGENVTVAKTWLDNDGVSLMQKCVHAKFSQNKSLKQELATTKGLCLVECNPYDTFWSCGKKLSEDGVSPSDWRGQNKLGFCLDEVRRTLIV